MTVVDRYSMRDVNQGTASLAGCHSKDSLRDAIRETTVFRPLSARLLTPSPLSMRYVSLKITKHSDTSMHEEIEKNMVLPLY